jgi:hypothetical protein
MEEEDQEVMLWLLVVSASASWETSQEVKLGVALVW